jgi:hypothetical protein
MSRAAYPVPPTPIAILTELSPAGLVQNPAHCRHPDGVEVHSREVLARIFLAAVRFCPHVIEPYRCSGETHCGKRPPGTPCRRRRTPVLPGERNVVTGAAKARRHLNPALLLDFAMRSR